MKMLCWTGFGADQNQIWEIAATYQRERDVDVAHEFATRDECSFVARILFPQVRRSHLLAICSSFVYRSSFL
jgi:hypothetical protein